MLNDRDTGFPVACLQSSIISATRTAASAVLAVTPVPAAVPDLGPRVILDSVNVVDDRDHCLRENTSTHLADMETPGGAPRPAVVLRRGYLDHLPAVPTVGRSGRTTVGVMKTARRATAGVRSVKRPPCGDDVGRHRPAPRPAGSGYWATRVGHGVAHCRGRHSRMAAAPVRGITRRRHMCCSAARMRCTSSGDSFEISS
nr:hypothetical protein [Micromonospora orduensis]